MISSISLSPIIWDKYNISEQKKLLARPAYEFPQKLKQDVENILKQVQQHGDTALQNLNLNLDNFHTDTLKIKKSLFTTSSTILSKTFKQAIHTAKNNITRFHQSQYIKEINLETSPGVQCRQIIHPLNSVGLYIPAGSAPLPSTVMMLGIPAKIANCPRIIICSPPPISYEILYTAKICGIQEVYQIGGAQAIAAMGFGTESITKVNKIFGPGNIWVTEAKRQISYKSNTAIDMLAGPSEILIIADNTANPKFIAADLLSQAEHGPTSHVILLTPNIDVINNVIFEIHKQIIRLSRIKIIIQSLKHSRLILNKNITECINISNQYAPEHLSIQTENPEDILQFITNAGSIFLGNWSPEAAGDYASGTNHVLPTYGCTTHTSGLSILDFQKRITIQKLTKNGLLKLAPTITTLAKTEKLTAHEESVKIRFNTPKEKNGYY